MFGRRRHQIPERALIIIATLVMFPLKTGKSPIAVQDSKRESSACEESVRIKCGFATSGIFLRNRRINDAYSMKAFYIESLQCFEYIWPSRRFIEQHRCGISKCSGAACVFPTGSTRRSVMALKREASKLEALTHHMWAFFDKHSRIH